MTVYVNNTNTKITSEREICDYFNNIDYVVLYNRKIIEIVTFIKRIDFSRYTCVHALFVELNCRPAIFGNDITPHFMLKQEYIKLFKHEYIKDSLFFKYLPSDIKLAILADQMMDYYQMRINNKEDMLLVLNLDYFIINYFMTDKIKELTSMNTFCSTYYSISLIIERMLDLYSTRNVVRCLRKMYYRHYHMTPTAKMFKLAVPRELRKYVFYHMPVIKNNKKR